MMWSQIQLQEDLSRVLTSLSCSVITYSLVLQVLDHGNEKNNSFIITNLAESLASDRMTSTIIQKCLKPVHITTCSGYDRGLL